MATLVITIVTPDTVADVTDALNMVPATGTIVEPSSIDHIARYIDGVANGSLNHTSVTVAYPNTRRYNPMMDHFDAKRGMVKQLIDMLKKNASDEVGSGLHKPEGEGDMAGIQVEKVEVLPDHEMDEPTPVHEVDTKMVPEGKESVLDAIGTSEPSKPDASAEEADVTDEEAGEGPSFPMMFGKKRKK